jgi:hypothetical protein
MMSSMCSVGSMEGGSRVRMRCTGAGGMLAFDRGLLCGFERVLVLAAARGG